MIKIKVFFVDYDNKTQQSRIICGKADIDDEKTAHIRLGPDFGGVRLEREAGDYIEAENFNNFWRRALEDKCKEMIKGEE